MARGSELDLTPSHLLWGLGPSHGSQQIGKANEQLAGKGGMIRKGVMVTSGFERGSGNRLGA